MKIINIFKEYWYYASEWHNAGCGFIINDTGVCLCDTRKNKKIIFDLIKTLSKEK